MTDVLSCELNLVSYQCKLILYFLFVGVFSLSVSSCTTFSVVSGNYDFYDSDIYFEITDPEELQYTYKIRPAKDFGIRLNESFPGQGIKLVPVEPACGCGWPNNADELEGNVALVERGECSFLSKTIRAEEAGARAVIVSDNDESGEDFYIEMIDDKTYREVNIPAGFLLKRNGNMIRKTLKKLQRHFAVINIPVNLTYVPLNKMNQPPWLSW